MASEADIGHMAIEVELSHNILLCFVAMLQIAAEGQSVKMASDKEVQMKQGCDCIPPFRKNCIH